MPRDTFGAEIQGHRSGVLLLLSSVAMAAVAVAGFVLFWRLRRLVAP